MMLASSSPYGVAVAAAASGANTANSMPCARTGDSRRSPAIKDPTGAALSHVNVYSERPDSPGFSVASDVGAPDCPVPTTAKLSGTVIWNFAVYRFDG